MIAAFSFLLGIAIGSFLNVCIYRLPQGGSVATPPRSYCPNCRKQIAAYDNIPLASYLLLGGKCRYCKVRISPVYFFVELATGLVFLLCYYLLGLSVEFLREAVFASLLIVLVMTDWQERILPDRINFPGIAIGLLFSLLVPVGDGSAGWLADRLAGLDLPMRAASFFDGVLGVFVGGGLLYLLGEVYFRLRHKEGMGFGDVKMMAMVGCFLGPKLTLLSILLGSVTGSVLGLVMIAALGKGTDFELPFGSFLGVSAFFASLWGWPILNWYRGFFP